MSKRVCLAQARPHRSWVRAASFAASIGCISCQAGAATEAEAALAGQVEEVIVTAQRREERLLETPISVGVLSGADLDRGGSRSIADVLNQVGGVSLIETQPGETQITIRGVVADPYSGTSTAAYYLDEVPFAFISTAQLPDANAFDLARVEILRGPQGTLYGANALSGVVRVLSNEAHLDEMEMHGRVRASDTSKGDANYSGDVAVNVPLVEDRLAVRGVVSYSDLSGYVDSSLTGQRRINDSQAQSYRFKANYKANESLSLKLGISRSRIENGAPSQSFEDLTTPFSANQGDERVYDAYNLIAEYDWENVSLLSSTAYLDYRADTQREILVAGTFNLNYFNHFGLNSFSQEFRLSSRLDGPWQWSAGGIWKDTKQLQLQSAPALFPSNFEDHNRSESYAVFAETTRSFAEGKFDVTGGVRYFRDDLTSTERSNFAGTPVTAPRPVDFDRVTGRVVFAYKPSSTQMFYGSVASGFRSGVNQTSAVAQVDSSFPAVKPDSLLTYEVGTKGDAFDGLVTYESSVYYTDWSDIQQGLILPIGFFAGLNAGDASGLGIDTSITIRPTSALMLQASVGWNDLKLDQDILSRLDDSTVLFGKGTRLNGSPEWTGSVGGTYRFNAPMANVDIVLSSSFAYRSDVLLRYLTGTALTQTESEALRSLRASIGLESGHWSVGLYGDNLLDDRNAITAPDMTYANNTVRQRPRTIGLQGTFKY